MKTVKYTVEYIRLIAAFSSPLEALLGGLCYVLITQPIGIK